MKQKTVKKGIALLLAAMMVSTTACGDISSNKQKEDLPTITLYSNSANLTSGLVTGHRADYFAENGFQLEVWAHSAEKTNAILSSGDLPDIMYVPKDHLEVMIEEEMILNLEDYIDKLPHLFSSEYAEASIENARKVASAGTGDLYGIPLFMGKTGNAVGITNNTDRYCLKLNWEAYEKIGAPEIKDVWELIDVLEQMVKATPDKDGVPIYGTNLSLGYQSSYWGNIQAYYSWFGYRMDRLNYLLEADMVNGTISSILTKDSKYYEGLKWYNEVYRRGLLDPDSINTDRPTQMAKVDEGLVMLAGATFNGMPPMYFEYLLPDTTIYFDGVNEMASTDYIVAINADTEHLDECLKYLDMLCDADAILRILYGPDGGGIWYTEGDTLHFTDRFMEHYKASGSCNGFVFDSGEEWVLYNTPFMLMAGEPTSYVDENGDAVPNMIEYCRVLQASTLEGDNYANWKETMGYDSWMDLLKDKDALCESSRLDGIGPYLQVPDDQMKLKRDSIKDVVVNASWQMVYAESEKEFESIWDKMVKDVEGLGAKELIEWGTKNIENAVKLKEDAAK